MTEPYVGIVLVNYRGVRDTLECIDSLQNMEYRNFFAVVVDNNSEDNSLQLLYRKKEEYDFSIIEMDKNRGFSAGNNAGIKYALQKGAEYVVLLNNDTLVDKKWLKKLVCATQDTPNCGISIGKIYYADTADKLWYAGGKLDLKTGKVTQYGLGKKDDFACSERREVSFATGCCMCIGAEVFKIVGYLNEKFFLYEEDTEFCYRVLKSGMKIIYEPSAIIFHKVSASTSDGSVMSPTTQYYMVRNRYIFLRETFRKGWPKIWAYSYSFSMYMYYWMRGIMKLKYICWALQDFYNGKTGKTDRKL